MQLVIRDGWVDFEAVARDADGRCERVAGTLETETIYTITTGETVQGWGSVDSDAAVAVRPVGASWDYLVDRRRLFDLIAQLDASYHRLTPASGSPVQARGGGEEKKGNHDRHRTLYY